MEEKKIAKIAQLGGVNKVGITEKASIEEIGYRKKLTEMFLNSPIPDNEKLANLGLFLNSKNLSRILFMNYIYKLQIDIQGVVMEFGTRWGQNAALFSQFRGIYEPYNRHRKVVAFDTFSGFPVISSEDGNSSMMQVGNYSTTEKYEDYLCEVMSLLEMDNPLGHLRKYEVIKGDCSVEIENYLNEHPETIISLAYFDLDIYEPTKRCLELIRDRLVKGSVLAFDELNDPDCPGETVALNEVIGLNNVQLKRLPYVSRVSYCIYEGRCCK